MKAIKRPIQYSILFLMGVLSCQEERSDLFFDPSLSFIRFSLKVDEKGDISTALEDNNLDDETDTYTSHTTDAIHVPILLSGVPLQDDLTVTYSTEISGTFSGVNIPSEDYLIIEAGTYMDTLTVSFTERWNPDNNTRITFRIKALSNPDVHIGYPRDFLTLEELNITLGELKPNAMNFSSNRVEFLGEFGEKVDFEIQFSQGILASELTDMELFSQIKGFDYTIVQHPFQDGDKKIAYTLTINENLQVDDVLYETLFTLNKDIEHYTLSGNTTLQLVKPLQITRDNTVFTASHFYDLTNPFHKIYGEQWNDFNEDGICQWGSFESFTFPIIVTEAHPNAVLYDDLGTSETADDIYHHAFRIGFNTVIPGSTTNAFNFKRWFSNESTSAVNSPGFNIQQAIAFFPENGNSATNGIIQIIPQNIVIAGTNGNSYTIAIEGEGIYQKLPSGIYALIFELRATNNALFGGTRTGYYHMFNSHTYIVPAPIGAPCMTDIEL